MTLDRTRRRRGSMFLPVLLLVVLAFGVLFYQGVTVKAPAVAEELEQACRRVVQRVDSGLWVRVDGRSVELEGRADTVEEVERAWQLLEEVEGVRAVVRSEPRLFLRSRTSAANAPAIPAETLEAWDDGATIVPTEVPTKRRRSARSTRQRRGPPARRLARSSAQTAPRMPALDFAPGSVTLTATARRQLDRTVGRLVGQEGLVVGVAVTGGGDGRDATRARAVRAALIARGMPAGAVRVTGGSALPSLDPPEGAPAVARAHLTVLRSAP